MRTAAFEAPQAELNECRLAQPVTFMLQCALVELFKTWGVYPDCVVGHSSGEVAAAYASGALALAEATRLVYHRATLQQRTAGSGRMLPIGLDLAGVKQLLDELQVPFRPPRESETAAAPPVEIACENAPASTVICGKEEALRPVLEELERRNLQHRLPPGNIAFHSAAMDPLEEDAHEALSFLNDSAFEAAVPFVSSVTGEHTERLDNAYWWTNVRRRGASPPHWRRPCALSARRGAGTRTAQRPAVLDRAVPGEQRLARGVHPHATARHRRPRMSRSAVSFDSS